LGSNGQNFKKSFGNFEAQIGQKLKNLRLDHFSEFLIKKQCNHHHHYSFLYHNYIVGIISIYFHAKSGGPGLKID